MMMPSDQYMEYDSEWVHSPFFVKTVMTTNPTPNPPTPAWPDGLLSRCKLLPIHLRFIARLVALTRSMGAY